MDKEATIESIQKARQVHGEQMSKIAALISGQSIQDPTALSQRECLFGQWFYGNEEHLKRILGMQFFTKLEENHSQWHKQYHKIYTIFFSAKSKKQGFFSKIVGANKVSPLELDKAKLYYAELKDNTEELVKIMMACERRIGALSDSKFI